MKKITVNGEVLNLYRVEGRPHGFTDLFVGETFAASRVTVPNSTYQNGGTVFTSGNRITVPWGGLND